MDAIKKTKGPCIVLAGAGTGKTHTIIEKIKYLIENKVYSPERIACITFSNEAANNLFMRVQTSLSLENGKEPVIRTFHAFSADLLRKSGHLIGINEEFNILDPDQAKVVLHKNLRVLPYYCRKYIATIGTAKDLGITLEDVNRYFQKEMITQGGEDLEKRAEELQFLFQTLHLGKKEETKKQILSKLESVQNLIGLKKFTNIWGAYEKIKAISNYQDYADLNTRALHLLKTHPEVANNYDYIIVDEFQDTNKVQLEFLFALATHGNITVVGDLNQSIYQFRGAYKENYSSFKKHFKVKENEVFALDKSYRSSNKILDVAHKLISFNYSNKEECFRVDNFEGREGESVLVYELKNGKEEARKIVEIVKSEIERGVGMEEICIIFRTHQQGRIIKNALEQEGLNYSSATKKSLLGYGAVKTIRDYLTIIQKIKREEKGGEQAWWDLFYQMQFSEGDLIRLGKMLKEKKDEPNLSKIVMEYLPEMELSPKGKIATQIIIERIKQMSELEGEDVVKMLPEIYRVSGLTSEQKSRKGKEVILNLNKFLELATTHSSLYSPDLTSFLHYLDVLEHLEIEVAAAELETEGIQLMTSHATKGLEYKTVIITNLAQKRFPMEKVENNSLLPRVLYPDISNMEKGLDEEGMRAYLLEQQIREERRLAYVSFTRAKEKLILTYAKEYAGKKFYPSQFLHEIEYQKHPEIKFILDNSELYQEPKLEIKPASRFGFAIVSNNFENILGEIVKNLPRDEVEEKPKAFSPSALLTFNECQKKYEYQYVYNMPEKKTLSWEAMRLGSFVHLVLEKGVEERYFEVKQFLDYAKQLHLEEDWASVEIEEAEHMIKVFFARNKGKYGENSLTEQLLPAELGGINFIGFADRIDITPKGVEIIDYKTGKQEVKPMHRRWQLGYYALAALKKFGKVHKMTLDMLKLENPLEFVLDEKGNAQGVNSERMDFNIYEVEEELIKTAREIISAREKGFKACPLEKNCEFCNEYVYGL